MSKENLYSIRMRASSCDTHLSGAERIVKCPHVRAAVNDLLERSFAKSKRPDQISITIEDLGDHDVLRLAALDVMNVLAPHRGSGRALAADVLVHTGVSAHAASLAIGLLSSGPAPDGKNMRGAAIMDARSGERLEPDQERGIRASHFDWTDHALQHTIDALATAGLFHFRTREALVLATKIAHASGVVAELCWSDDPDYTAGYVASLRTGYVRFPCLKEPGDPKGGRIIFVERAALDLDRLIAYLQNDPVLIDRMKHSPKEIGPDAIPDNLPRD